MVRLARSALLLLVVALTAASASASAALPGILTQTVKHPFKVRPAVIYYTGDSTGIIGGPHGTSLHHLGRIHWGTYTSRKALGNGLVWINDCDPACAGGHFSSTPVRLHAFFAAHGRFKRLTLHFTYRGKAYTDRRGIRRVDPGGGQPAFWIYYIL